LTAVMECFGYIDCGKGNLMCEDRVEAARHASWVEGNTRRVRNQPESTPINFLAGSERSKIVIATTSWWLFDFSSRAAPGRAAQSASVPPGRTAGVRSRNRQGRGRRHPGTVVRAPVPGPARTGPRGPPPPRPPRPPPPPAPPQLPPPARPRRPRPRPRPRHGP
jgi:hypothetical protein